MRSTLCPRNRVRYNAESGLYHYRARAYDASVGRFLQRDPLGYDDGPNPYQYVSSTPAGMVDPDGLRGRLKKAELKFSRAKLKLLNGMLALRNALLEVAGLQIQILALHVEYWDALAKRGELRRVRGCLSQGLARAFLSKLAEIIAQIESLSSNLDSATERAAAAEADMLELHAELASAFDEYIEVLREDLADDQGELNRLRAVLDDWWKNVMQDAWLGARKALGGGEGEDYRISSELGESGGEVIISGAGLVLGGVAGAIGKLASLGIKVKVGFHAAHHSFKWIGKARHIQLNTWRAGVKGSDRAYRLPIPWLRK